MRCGRRNAKKFTTPVMGVTARPMIQPISERFRISEAAACRVAAAAPDRWWAVRLGGLPNAAGGGAIGGSPDGSMAGQKFEAFLNPID
jgi:hypothetical protein